MTVTPSSFSRRSPVYRELERLGARFEDIGDCAVAWTCGADTATEIERVRDLAICDLSPLSLAGYKGWKAVTWLRGQGIDVGEETHMTYVQECGSRLARLTKTETLIFGELDVELKCAARLADAWDRERPAGAYPVPYGDRYCQFLISGEISARMFAKICGVDVRPSMFRQGAVAQTPVARVDSIIVRDDVGATLAYRCFTDGAAARYMWRCILDAMAEFDGRPVGLAAARALCVA